MSAPSRLARLLALVPWLAANDGITLVEAAEHFGVSVEQLEQDLWLLVVCGLPGYGPADLVDIQFWDDGRIHVLDPQTLRRPLRLTADEATALLLGLRVLQQVPGSVPGQALDRLVAKLETAIRAGEGSPADIALPAVAEPVRLALDEALASGAALAITYGAATRDEISERVVQPLRTVSIDGRSSLVAYCSLAEDVRTFRLDRILSATVRPAIPVPAVDARGGAVTDRSSEGDRSASTALLRLGPPARWIAEVHGGAMGQAAAREAGPEDVIEVSIEVHDLRWLGRLILSAGPHARVMGPPEAVSAVRAAAEAALAAYA